jgi:hypothetical protein
MKRGAKNQITQMAPEDGSSSSGGEDGHHQTKGRSNAQNAPISERVISVPKRRAPDSITENPFASLQLLSADSTTKQTTQIASSQEVNSQDVILNNREDGLKERDNILHEINNLNLAFSQSIQKAYSRDHNTDFTSLFPQYSKFRAQIEDRFGYLKEQMKKLSKPAEAEEHALPSPPKTQILVGTKMEKESEKNLSNFDKNLEGSSKQNPKSLFPFVNPASNGQEYPNKSEVELAFKKLKENMSKPKFTQQADVSDEEKDKNFESSPNQKLTKTFTFVRKEEPKKPPFDFAAAFKKMQENASKHSFTQKSENSESEGEEITPFESQKPAPPFKLDFERPINAFEKEKEKTAIHKFSFGQSMQEESPLKPFSLQGAEKLPEQKPFQFSVSSQTQQEPLKISFDAKPELKPFSFGSQSQEQQTPKAPFKFSFGSQEQSLPSFKFGGESSQPLGQFSFSKPAQPAEDGDAEGSGGEEEFPPTQEEPPANKELIETGAGEEGETTLWQSRCKLFKLEGSNTWKDLGVGLLKLNSKSDIQRRLLIRAERTGKVLLNVDVKGIVVDYKEERPKEITLMSSHDSGRYLLRSKDEIKPLFNLVRSK